MDIVGKETLEKMLKDYEGTILFVSHDRYFIKQVSNKLLAFEDGYTKFYNFGYEDYVAEKAAEAEKEKEVVASDNKAKANKTYDNPGKERSKLQRKLAKIEESIAVYEEEIKKQKEELLNPEFASMYTKLSEIQEKIDEIEETLMEAMEQWEIVTKELEAL
jgi:ATP-binding cassette subfamily F protein 3